MTRLSLKIFAAAFTAFSLATQAQIAAAQEPSAEQRAIAQRLFDEGLQSMDANEIEAACPKFEESQRLDPAMGTQFNLALCYEKQGRTASAWVNYVEVADSALNSGQADRERIARQHASALEPHLSFIVLRVEGDASSVSVTRNREPISSGLFGTKIPVDPGAMRIEASAEGKKPWSTDLQVGADGAVTEIVIPAMADELTAAPIATPAPVRSATTSAPSVVPASAPPLDSTSGGGWSTQRYWALSAGALGVVSLGAGSVMLLSALDRQANADCNSDGECTSDDGVEDLNESYSLANWATIPLVLGVAGVGAGALLWFTAEDAPSGSARVGVGPGRVAISGSF